MKNKIMDYSKAIIYKVVPINGDMCDVYYGASISTLSVCMYRHKKEYERNRMKNNATELLFNKYGVNNCDIRVVEELKECKSKEEMNNRLQFYIYMCPCINYINKLSILSSSLLSQENKLVSVYMI